VLVNDSGRMKGKWEVIPRYALPTTRELIDSVNTAAFIITNIN
jgi:hypothetical protein